MGTEPILTATWMRDHSTVSIYVGVLPQGITAGCQALFPAVKSWVFGSQAGIGWSYPANWNSLEPCIYPQVRAQFLQPALQYSTCLFGDSE